MNIRKWWPAASIVGVALLVSSCAENPAPADVAAADDGSLDAAGSSDAVEAGEVPDGVDADYLEWEAAQAEDADASDMYAPPLPPAEDSPPIAAYDEVPTPENPFDHELISTAFAEAQAQGADPDETGLIELDEALWELDIDGTTFTIDGVINPGDATPLYEDEHSEGDISLTPVIEELTNIPWPERREDILRDQESEAACGDGRQHLWLSFDTEQDPTCFQESGGVVDPYFRTISAICHASGPQQARTLYMGLGGGQSFQSDFGQGTGWDLMYRSPRIVEPNSCYAFTVPVRGAVASFGDSAH